jgi:hypothetical protein
MKTTLISVMAFAGFATASPVTNPNLQTIGGERPASTTTTLTIDLSGVNSWDTQGDSDNLFSSFGMFGTLVGGGAQIMGVSWDVTIETVGASWLSEASIRLSNTADTASYTFAPGEGSDFAGVMNFAGSTDLVATGDDFTLNADSILTIEFFESFDDVDGAIDATYLTGSTLTILYKPVPTPGALGLLGFGAIVGTRRRR